MGSLGSVSRVVSRGRVLAVVLAVAAAGLVVAGPSVPVGAVTPADDGGYLRLYANTNGGGDAEQVYARWEAVALAERFDVAVALRWTFDDYADAMYAADDQFRMFAYMNGAFSKPKDAPSMPDSWFLKDAAGRRVTSVVWGNFYMDPASAGWRDWVAQRCADWTALSGFDGCMMDDLGAGNLTSDNLSAHPVDPRTGKLMETDDWIGYVAGLSRRVVAENPGILVAVNGLNNGPRFFGNGVVSKRLLAEVDAGIAEGWLRNEYGAVDKFRSEADWRAEVDMLVEAGRMDKSVLVQTKVWIDASDADVKHWRRYTYASFLLGTDGESYLNFNPVGAGKPPPAHAWEQVNIGVPLEGYVKRGGVYQRRFTDGIAMVNPTDSSVWVTLDEPYQRLNGSTVTAFSLPANDGEILQKTTTPSAPPPTPPPPPPPTPSPTSGKFVDDDGSIFETDIEWIASEGITTGCNPPTNSRFCPDADVTRGQLAAFLVRALDLTVRLDDPFVDDDDSIFEADIEKLAAAGITKGCNPPANNRFCPTGKLTREQMAAFLVRALKYTDEGRGDLFADDNSSIFEADIDRLGTAGVTTGCNPPANDRFCPTANVTRGQMAAFLHRSLG